MKGLTGKRWWSALLFAAAVVVLYKAIGSIGVLWNGAKVLIDVLSPFIGGFVIAFLLYRPCDLLESAFAKSRWRLFQKPARVWAIVIVYLGLFVVLGLVVAVILPMVLEGVTGLVKSLPNYYTIVTEFVQNLSKENELFASFNISDVVNSLYEYLRSHLTVENILSYLSEIVSITSSFVSALVAVIISVYMLAGRKRLFASIGRLCKAFLSDRAVRLGGHYCHKAADVFSRYMYSMLLDALCVSILLIPGLLISGIPYPLSFAVFIGVANLIPYFGAIVGGAFTVLVLLLSTGNWGMAIFLAVYILVAQQLDSNLLQPRLFGQSVGIEPIYVLLAITVGGGLGGFVGMLIGVPVVAVVKILVSDLIAHRNHVKKQKEQAAAAGQPQE